MRPDTYAFFGMLGNFDARLVHVLPPSLVMWTMPSSDAGVDDAGLLRRFHDLHEVAVRLHAVVLGDGEVLGDHAHERQRFAIDVLRQVAADRRATTGRDRSI